MTQPIVLVLAGGASNRFWPLRDKPLVRLGGYTLLERHLRALIDMHCDRAIVVCNPSSREAIEAIAASLSADVKVAVQERALGMADAMLAALPLLEALGDAPIYVTQAQDVVEQSLHAEMLSRWDASGDDLFGLMAAQRVQSYFPGGYLTLEGNRVTSVIEKPGAGREPSDLVNLVAHVFASWRRLTESLQHEATIPGADDAYERALSRLMREEQFRPVVYEGRWQALKYPWHLLDVMDMLLGLWAAGSESPGDRYEQREGGVFIGRDVHIYPGGYISGPALIEDGSVIGNNALVRGSVIGPNCVVGFGSEVARSNLVRGVELHHNYIGDSVIDDGAALGYGATTANYRIDGRTVPSMVAGERLDSGRMKLGLMLGAGSRVGVNTSTMPGVKIGAGAMIGPMLRVTRDVPDGERVLDEEVYGRF